MCPPIKYVLCPPFEEKKYVLCPPFDVPRLQVRQLAGLPVGQSAGLSVRRLAQEMGEFEAESG